jgi:hypothetical protein
VLDMALEFGSAERYVAILNAHKGKLCAKILSRGIL